MKAIENVENKEKSKYYVSSYYSASEATNYSVHTGNAMQNYVGEEGDILNIPPVEYMCVEIPGVIKNNDKINNKNNKTEKEHNGYKSVLKALGEENLLKVCNNPKKIPLVLRFCYDDICSKFIGATYKGCTNILVKVIKRKSGKVEYKIMGKVTQKYYFDCIADFHISPPEEYRLTKDIENELDESVVSPFFIPPPHFSRLHTPFPYTYETSTYLQSKNFNIETEKLNKIALALTQENENVRKNSSNELNNKNNIVIDTSYLDSSNFSCEKNCTINNNDNYMQNDIAENNEGEPKKYIQEINIANSGESGLFIDLKGKEKFSKKRKCYANENDEIQKKLSEKEKNTAKDNSNNNYNKEKEIHNDKDEQPDEQDENECEIISSYTFQSRKKTAESIMNITAKFSDKNVPSKPSPLALKAPVEKVLFDKMSELFSARPLWLRHAIDAHLPKSFSTWKKKPAFAKSCYLIIDGPWRFCLCRYGYDPKTDPSARKYQTIDFRGGHFRTIEWRASKCDVAAKRETDEQNLKNEISKIELEQVKSENNNILPNYFSSLFSSSSSVLLPSSQLTEEHIPAPESADNNAMNNLTEGTVTYNEEDCEEVDRLLSAKTKYHSFLLPPIRPSQQYQLCEIEDKSLQNIIQNAPYSNTCTRESGWFTKETLEKIRDMMIMKCNRMRRQMLIKNEVNHQDSNYVKT